MLNFAIIGCGGMADWHAQLLNKLSSEVNVVAYVDPLADRTAKFKEKYSHDAAEFESLEALLEKPPAKLDAVVIVTPHTLHYPQAKMALEAGLHVLVEKPMVTSSEHAYDLWRTAKRSGKKLDISFQSGHRPEFTYLAAERDAGRLGKVQIISGWVAQNWCKGTGKSWRHDPAQSGGGYMYDTGAHLLNALMWLMNEPVVEVSCFYDKIDCPVDINGVVNMRFQSGAFGSATMIGNCPVFRSEMQISTDRLLIMTDQYGTKLDIRDHDGKSLYPHVPADTRRDAGTPVREFVDALLDFAPVRCPPRYGVLLSALMDAMYESADTRKPVSVQPVPTDIDV